ncbi:hypothetical protein [Leucobacter sp. G161]|uniref:hypothetical protein n=1 Tax=Leucobacter sp. G161 TaxID=663704 RepID=UPI000AF8A1CE|nr:hypothetical protein [Leucobacter sp. G161]
MAQAQQQVTGTPPGTPDNHAARALPDSGPVADVEVGQFLNRGLSPGQTPP